MAIQFIGASSNVGNSVSSMPTHQAGDLIVIVAYRDNGLTIDPPNYWQAGGISSGASNAILLGWTIALNAACVSGAWANATEIAALVYRSLSNGLLANVRNTVTGAASVGVGGNISYPALSAFMTPLDSWYIGAAGHRSNDTDIQVAPAGMTNRTSIAGGGTGELAVHDTAGTASAWSATNYVLTAGTASAYRSIVAQIVEYEGPAASGGAVRPLSRILNTGA